MLNAIEKIVSAVENTPEQPNLKDLVRQQLQSEMEADRMQMCLRYLWNVCGGMV